MQDWFLKIFNLYVDDIYRLSFSYTHNKFDSEDITQRVFIKYFNKMEAINQNELEVKKWLIVTTINECKDLFKSAWHRYTTSYSDDVTSTSNLDNEFFYYIDKLPKKYRLIFHLYYYYGYTTKEISKLIKLKESTIRQRLSRGRKILKLERNEENE